MPGALRVLAVLLAAVTLVRPAEADSFEERAALILGGLWDGASHRVDPALRLRRIRTQPLAFALDNTGARGRVLISVVQVGPCRARMTAYLRDPHTKRQSVRSSLLFDFGKLTELEFVLGRDEAGETVPSVHFAGRSGVCSSRGPGAACELGLLRHGFRSSPEQLRAAVTAMSRQLCPIPGGARRAVA